MGRPLHFSLKWLKPPEMPPDGSMTLFEHLRELRYRLVVSAVAIICPTDGPTRIGYREDGTGRKIRITYRDEQGASSRRTIWPVIIGYFDAWRLLAGWCELRQDFRHFRTDRIVAADFLDERYPRRPGDLKLQWQRTIAAKRASP